MVGPCLWGICWEESLVITTEIIFGQWGYLKILCRVFPIIICKNLLFFFFLKRKYININCTFCAKERETFVLFIYFGFSIHQNFCAVSWVIILLILVSLKYFCLDFTRTDIPLTPLWVLFDYSIDLDKILAFNISSKFQNKRLNSTSTRSGQLIEN